MILLLGWTDWEGPQLAGIYETLYLAEHYIREHDPSTPDEVIWRQSANDEPDNSYTTPTRRTEFRCFEIKPDMPLVKL